MSSYIWIAAASALGGFVQSILGFGFGMISVLFFPSIMGSLPQSSAVTATVSMIASLLVLVRCLKHVRLKYIIFTIAANFLVMPIMTRVAKIVPLKPLSLVLGITMILFSVYYIRWNQKIRFRPTALSASAAGALGGTLGGLFALGGVPVGIYLLNAAETKEIYHATMQAYLVITDVYGTAVRISNGIIQKQTLLWIAAGTTGMVLGVLLGKKCYERIDHDRMRILVYILIGFGGLTKIIGYFL